ncbi:hypothetical protein WJX81_008352 [Elliptochloris bilobata]|uniref:Choline monooxygenase, chloroplastic n=1 Tax=Elliptochloris bilobata TaxID=381761 RepID=A0AAW1RN53_9CHLO
MDANKRLRAFHNVCRHHAAAVAEDRGRTDRFTCPYHGWEYGLDGRLLKATRVAGIRNFRAADYGLVPVSIGTWGPFMFVHLGREATDGADADLHAWLGEGGHAMTAAGVADSGLKFVTQREYRLGCNWKVYCDNYLDGGYHVAHAHKALACSLDLASYCSRLYENVSEQTCSSSAAIGDRLGGRAAAYFFIYPNFMVNRYGPWLDVSWVVPDQGVSSANGMQRCLVRTSWWLDADRAQDGDFVAAGIAASEEVQQEDIWLCESVQRGLASPAYDSGRYAPGVETPMHHFHRLLHRDLFPDPVPP